MRLEETIEYRCYLCLAWITLKLAGDQIGSDGHYDDTGYFKEHITELLGGDIDRVFHSQQVHSIYGSKRWAFANPANDFRGDDLEVRLFHDRDQDLYYLLHRPTQNLFNPLSLDMKNNILTAFGAGVPDKYQQAARLMELVRPEFRDKIVLSGFSLGGGLSAYAALQASWPVRTIVFDPLGLNRNMMGRRGSGFFGQGEVLSERLRHMDGFVDWYYIPNSWVAKENIRRNLSSVGRVTELPRDPARRPKHDMRNVRFGLRRLWDEKGWHAFLR